MSGGFENVLRVMLINTMYVRMRISASQWRNFEECWPLVYSVGQKAHRLSAKSRFM